MVGRLLVGGEVGAAPREKTYGWNLFILSCIPWSLRPTSCSMGRLGRVVRSRWRPRMVGRPVPGATSRDSQARRAQAQATLPGTFQISLERAFSRKKEISIIFSGYKVIEVLSWSLDLALLKIKIV